MECEPTRHACGIAGGTRGDTPRTVLAARVMRKTNRVRRMEAGPRDSTSRRGRPPRVAAPTASWTPASGRPDVPGGAARDLHRHDRSADAGVLRADRRAGVAG